MRIIDEDLSFPGKGKEMIEYVKEIAREAGGIMRGKFEVFAKDSSDTQNDIVTSADFEVEHFLIDRLSSKYPAYDFFSEETPDQQPASDHVWVIDPIDGTKNFAHGLPLVAISIGLLREGIPILGVIYNPLLEEMYWAKTGSGTFKNGRPIHASSIEEIAQSLVLIEGGTICDKNRQYPKKLNRLALAIRHLGCASLNLAYIAEGIVDAYIDEDLKCYDIAAGIVILEEAGGKITNLANQPLFPRPFDYTDIDTVATNGKVHSKFLSIVNEG